MDWPVYAQNGESHKLLYKIGTSTNWHVNWENADKPVILTNFGDTLVSRLPQLTHRQGNCGPLSRRHAQAFFWRSFQSLQAEKAVELRSMFFWHMIRGALDIDLDQDSWWCQNPLGSIKTADLLRFGAGSKFKALADTFLLGFSTLRNLMSRTKAELHDV